MCYQDLNGVGVVHYSCCSGLRIHVKFDVIIENIINRFGDCMTIAELGQLKVFEKLIILGARNTAIKKEGEKSFITFDVLNGKTYKVIIRAKMSGTWQAGQLVGTGNQDSPGLPKMPYLFLRSVFFSLT